MFINTEKKTHVSCFFQATHFMLISSFLDNFQTFISYFFAYEAKITLTKFKEFVFYTFADPDMKLNLRLNMNSFTSMHLEVFEESK